MTRVLVTGGNGVLGGEVVTKLVGLGYTVRVMSRRSAPADMQAGLEWVQVDLESGQGLAEAVQGVEVVVHAASSPFKHTRQVDVEGTGRLLEAVRVAQVGHFIYISIVGIEKIPFGYYRSKLAAEELIKSSEVPWSILRAAQFYSFFERLFEAAAKVPVVMPVPGGLKSQPVADSEVASRLCELVAADPAGRVPDMYGPKVWTWGELAPGWLAARGIQRRVIQLPLPGKAAQGFRRGYNTCLECPEDVRGKITWDMWLRQKYGR